ncbi:MAG TPA: hypothetical protein VMS12_09715 [Thermoanaerobaculia bacterium]|nr:hypothetical protein [Thermoanaerobaculia bacterium]
MLRIHTLCGLSIFLFLTLPLAGSEWYDLYDEAVRLFEQGNDRAAIEKLERALELQPAESLRLRVRPGLYVDYLPHAYLAAAYLKCGDPEAARHHFLIAERSGVAERSEAGEPLMSALRSSLGGPAPAPEVEPLYRRYEKKSPVLSAEEYAKVRASIAQRCAVPPDAPSQSTPWYFHYELALELERRGDSQRALDAMIDATDRKPDPRLQSRMYGMWFTDYTPYYYIARLHAQLQNWSCAIDALELSKELRELPQSSPLRVEMEALERDLVSRTVDQ